MNKGTDHIWEFMGNKGQVVFTGNKDEVQREAKKNFFNRRISSGLKYRAFDRTAVTEETQKPEWKAVDDGFYTDAGISKEVFLRSENIGLVIAISGLVVIFGGGLTLAVIFLLPNIIPHGGASGSPVAVGYLVGSLFGLLAGVGFVWKKFGPIAGILTLIGGIAAIRRII